MQSQDHSAKALELEQQFHQAQHARYIPHIPFERQLMFLNITDPTGAPDEALFGGQAGGAKSDSLLMDALEYVDVPGYAAILFRRTFTDLALPGALMDRAHGWLRRTPAKFDSNTKTYTFPTGTPTPATLTFAYLEHEKDKFRYQSAAFQYCGFDELTQFEETQYRYLFSRLRRPKLPCVLCEDSQMELEMREVNGVWQWAHAEEPEHPHEAEPDAVVLREYPSSIKRNLNIFQVPLKMRAGTNPGGVGAEWVKERFIPDDFMPEDAIIPKVWSKEVQDPEEPDEQYKTTTYFVPSRKEDNPFADIKGYTKSLAKLGRVERKQLGEGDWTITAAGRSFFTLVAMDLYNKRIPAQCEVLESTNDFGESKFIFREVPGGLLAVWKQPVPGHRYILGCDTATGRDFNRGEGKVRTDWSVTQVHDLDTHEQVARLRGRISQRHFGEWWYRLHILYNFAYVVPAVTGGYGQASLDRAQDLGLPTEYVYVQRNKRKPDHPPISGDKGGLALGFVENTSTRLPLYTALDTAYVEHAIELYDAVTINETRTFEFNKDGKPEARAGCFDDTVTAYALVIEGIPYAPWGLWELMKKTKQIPQIINYAAHPGETEQQRQQRRMEERIRASRSQRKQ